MFVIIPIYDAYFESDEPAMLTKNAFANMTIISINMAGSKAIPMVVY
jgi:hypothetical protein